MQRRTPMPPSFHSHIPPAFCGEGRLIREACAMGPDSNRAPVRRAINRLNQRPPEFCVIGAATHSPPCAARSSPACSAHASGHSGCPAAPLFRRRHRACDSAACRQLRAPDMDRRIVSWHHNAGFAALGGCCVHDQTRRALLWSDDMGERLICASCDSGTGERLIRSSETTGADGHARSSVSTG